MAVELHLLTVVVRKAALARMPEEAQALARSMLTSSPDLFREDVHLAATSFMGPGDVGDFLKGLRDLGFPELPAPEAWTNLAVVDQFEGPTLPALWLQWAPPFHWEGVNPFDLLGGVEVLIHARVPRTRAEIPRVWLDGQPEGSLSEVPYLAADPDLRGAFWYQRRNPDLEGSQG